MAASPVRSLTAHCVGHERADVAALGDVAGVAEPVHQLCPRSARPTRLPAELGRLGREAVAGQGRQHQMERVFGASAVRGRVRQRADRVEQLHDRAGPAVGHDQRQRILMLRPHVDEVDVHAVDLGRELRQRVQPRFDAPEVVVGRPVSGELLEGRQLDALRAIVDEFLAGPARRLDAPAEVGDLLLRDIDVELPNVGGCDGGAHEDSSQHSSLNAARSSFVNPP